MFAAHGAIVCWYKRQSRHVLTCRRPRNYAPFTVRRFTLPVLPCYIFLYYRCRCRFSAAHDILPAWLFIYADIFRDAPAYFAFSDARYFFTRVSLICWALRHLFMLIWAQRAAYCFTIIHATHYYAHATLPPLYAAQFYARAVLRSPYKSLMRCFTLAMISAYMRAAMFWCRLLMLIFIFRLRESMILLSACYADASAIRLYAHVVMPAALCCCHWFALLMLLHMLCFVYFFHASYITIAATYIDMLHCCLRHVLMSPPPLMPHISRHWCLLLFCCYYVATLIFAAVVAAIRLILSLFTLATRHAVILLPYWFDDIILPSCRHPLCSYGVADAIIILFHFMPRAMPSYDYAPRYDYAVYARCALRSCSAPLLPGYVLSARLIRHAMSRAFLLICWCCSFALMFIYLCLFFFFFFSLMLARRLIYYYRHYSILFAMLACLRLLLFHACFATMIWLLLLMLIYAAFFIVAFSYDAVAFRYRYALWYDATTPMLMFTPPAADAIPVFDARLLFTLLIRRATFFIF